MAAIFKLYQLFAPNKLRRRLLNQVGLLTFSVPFRNGLASQLVSHGIWLELQHVNLGIVAMWFYPKDEKQRTPLCQDEKNWCRCAEVNKRDGKRTLMVFLGLIPLFSEAQCHSSPYVTPLSLQIQLSFIVSLPYC